MRTRYLKELYFMYQDGKTVVFGLDSNNEADKENYNGNSLFTGKIIHIMDNNNPLGEFQVRTKMDDGEYIDYNITTNNVILYSKRY